MAPETIIRPIMVSLKVFVISDINALDAYNCQIMIMME